MRVIALSLSLFLFLTGVAASSALAAPETVGKFGVWTVYSFMEDGAKVCFMSASPEKAEGKYTKRGNVYAMVTQRPQDGTRDVFSYITGYEYRKGGEVTVLIDGQKFLLYGDGETAWTTDASADSKLTQAMRKGSKMVVKGTSARGTDTVDTFSLKGSGAAHDATIQECGLK
jgi:hypothetical protein